jgi:hypothetical protein
MLGDIVRTLPDIAQIFRDRIHTLGITYATVDAVAGLADGYTAKVLSNPPQKAMGGRAMVLIAGALGICFVPIVDHQQSARVHARWEKRKRAPSYPALECVAENSLCGDAIRNQTETFACPANSNRSQ